MRRKSCGASSAVAAGGCAFVFALPGLVGSGCTAATAPAEDRLAVVDVSSAEKTAETPIAAGASKPMSPATKASPVEALKRRTVAKPVVGEYAADVPPVLLSAEHAALCTVGVGDSFPALELPRLGDGVSTKVSTLGGKKATVIVFWAPDRWMARAALADLKTLLAGAGPGRDVGAVAVVEQDAPGQAQRIIAETGATFPQLADAGGGALAQVGAAALPRIYVLDASGRIAWFDIEYSQATRRELQQTLAALTK